MKRKLLPFYYPKCKCGKGRKPVVHYTYEGKQEQVFLDGLRALCDMPDLTDVRVDEVETMRACSVFAFPMDAWGKYKSAGGYGGRTYPICACVKPKEALVSDMNIATSLMYASNRTGEEAEETARALAEEYMEKTITLKEYLSMPLKDRALAYREPEVLLPHGIEPKYLKRCEEKIKKTRGILKEFFRLVADEFGERQMRIVEDAQLEHRREWREFAEKVTRERRNKRRRERYRRRRLTSA